MRFNVARGGSAQLDDLDRFARRVHDLAGWHTELYIDARTIDSELAGRLVAPPAVSIDHLGMHADGLPMPPASSRAASGSRPPGSVASSSTPPR